MSYVLCLMSGVLCLDSNGGNRPVRHLQRNRRVIATGANPARCLRLTESVRIVLQYAVGNCSHYVGIGCELLCYKTPLPCFAIRVYLRSCILQRKTLTILKHGGFGLICFGKLPTIGRYARDTIRSRPYPRITTSTPLNPIDDCTVSVVARIQSVLGSIRFSENAA